MRKPALPGGAGVGGGYRVECRRYLRVRVHRGQQEGVWVFGPLNKDPRAIPRLVAARKRGSGAPDVTLSAVGGLLTAPAGGGAQPFLSQKYLAKGCMRRKRTRE